MTFRTGGGLRFSTTRRLTAIKAPQPTDLDVSWMPRVRGGNDQGQVGACAMFAMGDWSEIMWAHNISDADRIAVYKATCRTLGRGDEGLTYQEAFDSAKDAGWLPGARGLVEVDDFSRLAEQPILAAYKVTPAWQYASDQGCLDESQPDTDLGGHAVCVIAHGTPPNLPEGVWIENHWVPWGWNGLGVMTRDLHARTCRELWIIE